MQKRGQRLQRKQQTSSSKPWWVCMIAALSFCLWSVNLLPILQVEYQLTTNLAISQHRIPLLQRLSCQPNSVFTGTSNTLRSLEILPENTNPATTTISELRSVRVKIRCPTRRGLNDVVRCLDELTTPTLETDECQEFANQLIKERWLLESSVHLLKRLELDREHDRNAIEIEKIANESIDEHTTSTPFRLTSYGSRENLPQPQLLPLDSLHQLIQSRTDNVFAMMLTLEKLKAKSRGFLSLTGSPSLNPVVRPLSIFRIAILCILCVCVWLLLLVWLRPIESYAKFGTRWKTSKQTNLARWSPIPMFGRSGVKETLNWMNRAGIPYLGTIQVLTDDASVSTKALKTHSRLTSDSSETESSRSNSKIFIQTQSFDATKLLRSIGEGSLVLWIGLFAARLLFDPAFRELVPVAPLAAISRMILGIQ